MTNTIHLTLVYLLWGIVTFFFMVIFLTLFRNRRSFYDEPSPLKNQPGVSVIVPAYNEERTIRETINSLLDVDYPRDLLEIIVVNDGSRDRTGDIVGEYVRGEGITYINNERNVGKAGSLNIGVEKARFDLVACIDADTVIKPDTIKKTINYFNDGRVGAVIVRVNVKAPKNWLERIIAVEYNMGLGFYLKIFSFLNCLHLTPGQFSIYRRDMLIELGGFDENSIVEDTEIAYRIQKAQYKVECCLSAEAFTAVPDNLKSLYYQRRRWYSGSILTIIQHRDVFFNKGLGNFGLFFMPVNYGGIILGILLFLSTIYLTTSLLLVNISQLALVDYDIYSLLVNFISHPEIDPLSINILYFLCITPFIMNTVMNYMGIRLLGEKLRGNIFGFVCFMFFFIPYNIFWLIFIYLVIVGKEIKWRKSM